MIEDKEAIRFVNEQLRPLCESVRAVKARIVAASLDWDRIKDKFPKSASEEIADGRELEGVSRLTGDDVNKVLEIFAAAASQIDDILIAKPCVRSLSVS